MGWDYENAQKELDWLRFMSQYKYDDYRGYLVGTRFIESLANWLQQFKPGDERRTAYKYIKENLIYIGPAEIQRLVGRFFHEEVKKTLRAAVSERLKKKVAKNLPEYMAWSEKESMDEFKREVRRTLFMGLSDGARLDSFRRANEGIISNEQVVITTEISKRKWKDLLKELKKDLIKMGKGEGEGKRKFEGKLKKVVEIIKRKWEDLFKKKQKFERVYLIDDFTASGTSFIREENRQQLKGKLKKFAVALQQAEKDLGKKPFVDKFEVLVHHYIATSQAKKHIEKLYKESWVKKELKEMGIRKEVQFSYGMTLPEDIRLTRYSKEKFAELCKSKDYYDPSIHKNEHFPKGEAPDGKFGYAECGLPLILYHNTPNNSLSLLWAETKGDNGKHAMRPLFKRGQRHVGRFGEDHG